MLVGVAVQQYRPRAASADEAPGLPPGAAQFQRLLRAQRQWDDIGTAFTSREAGEIGAEEWEGTRAFLRNFYRAGEDMEFLAGGMEGDTKKRAVELSREFRKFVRSLDKPLIDKDLEGFRAGQETARGMIASFFSFLEEASDIPDEL